MMEWFEIIAVCVFQIIVTADGWKTCKTSLPIRSVVKIYALDMTPLCGGTLLAPFWVLTAAHCPVTRQSKVIAGMLDAETYGRREHILSKVDRFIRHPGYNAKKLENDVALLYLRTPVKRNANIDYVKIPMWASNDLERKCPEFLVASWGELEGKPFKRALQCKMLALIESSSCSRNYDTSFNDSGKVMCIACPAESPCQGISGGPVFCGDSCGDTQEGIVTWNKWCKTRTDTDELACVFQRVDKYLGFIESHVDIYNARSGSRPANTSFDVLSLIFLTVTVITKSFI